MVSTGARAFHDLPRPDKPLETRSSSLKTTWSKLGFGRTQVTGTRTRDHRFKLQVGCLRNQWTRPARWAVLPSLEITNSTKNWWIQTLKSDDIGRFRPDPLRSRSDLYRYREISAISRYIRLDLMRSGNISAKIRPNFAPLWQTRNQPIWT